MASMIPALTPERVLRRMEWRRDPPPRRPAAGRLPHPVPRHRDRRRGSARVRPGRRPAHIDWNVTARMDTPYVREYVEDRKLTVVAAGPLADFQGFGSGPRLKKDIADRCGGDHRPTAGPGRQPGRGMLFDTGVQETIPPGHGRNQVLRILSRLMAPADPRASGTTASRAAAAGRPHRPAPVADRHRSDFLTEPRGAPAGPRWRGGTTSWPCRSSTRASSSSPPSA